jgi:hypothetical protein
VPEGTTGQAEGHFLVILFVRNIIISFSSSTVGARLVIVKNQRQPKFNTIMEHSLCMLCAVWIALDLNAGRHAI